MPEIETNNDRGYPLNYNNSTIYLELYQLLTYFEASKKIRKIPELESTGLLEDLNDIEKSQISRLLLNLSIYGRHSYEKSLHLEDFFDEVIDAVGSISENTDPVDSPSRALGLRDSFNKIIHAERINWDTPLPLLNHKKISSPDKENSEIDNLGLNPIIHLYGEHRTGGEWRATIQIHKFVSVYCKVIEF